MLESRRRKARVGVRGRETGNSVGWGQVAGQGERHFTDLLVGAVPSACFFRISPLVSRATVFTNSVPTQNCSVPSVTRTSQALPAYSRPIDTCWYPTQTTPTVLTLRLI